MRFPFALVCLCAIFALVAEAAKKDTHDQVCLAVKPSDCDNFILPLEKGRHKIHRIGYLKKYNDNDVCQRWNDACRATARETSIPFVVSKCTVVKGTSTAKVFCNQYRNHGGTWAVTGEVAKSLGVWQLKKR